MNQCLASKGVRSRSQFRLLTATLLVSGAFGCSGTSSVGTPPDNGGTTSQSGGQTTGSGGSMQGGATNGGGTKATGGISPAGGSTSMAQTGGTSGLATGGAAPTGGKTSTGGTLASSTGGTKSTGGSSAFGTGGNGTTGGSAAVTGGSKATGGSSSVTGGTKTTGGSSATTGGKATGGANTGGASPTGGTSTVGGSTSCPAPTPGSKGTNPLFTDVFTADPAAMVHNCTFYVQCGHDEGAGNYFTMYEWFLLKSTDMVHWTRTVGMRYTVFSWAHGNAWAGQMVAGTNGKFYWYVPVEQGNGNGQMAIGVAVADSPEGPFKDAIGKPLVDDAFERSNMGFATDGDTPYTIDPTVFVDDDGQAYLHYGGFSRLVNAKLGADMVSISGTMKESTPSCYFESPYLIKRNNIYYEIYACGANPPTIDYATSSSPLGPWTRKGTVLPKMVTLSGQDPATNHAGVAQLGNQWYIVYHVSNGPNGGGTYHREVAIDKMNFNSDGSIQQVTPSSGLTF